MSAPASTAAEPSVARSDFDDLVAPTISGLRLHCYRLVGSLEDAEDMVQEALTRAWRTRDRVSDPAGMRPWLFRIATNACLDLLDHRRRRPTRPFPSEGPWPDPLPDDWREPAPTAVDPAAIVMRQEAIDLAFLTAVQRLAPRPRAILILRDVLEWSADDVATALDTTEAAVHSAVRRARRQVEDEARITAQTTSDAWAVARRYADAWNRADMIALADLLAADARMAMPPDPRMFIGRAGILAYFRTLLAEPPEPRIRLHATSANGGPAFVVLATHGDHDADVRIGVKVLVVGAGLVAEIRGYMRTELADRFELVASEH